MLIYLHAEILSTFVAHGADLLRVSGEAVTWVFLIET
jgi:hypothetical protein